MQLFIGGITPEITHDDLHDHFTKFGNIRSLKIIDTYGFIIFESREDAFKALDSGEHKIKGNRIVLEEALGRNERVRKTRDETDDVGERKRDDYFEKRKDAYTDRREDFSDRRGAYNDRSEEFPDRRRDFYEDRLRGRDDYFERRDPYYNDRRDFDRRPPFYDDFRGRDRYDDRMPLSYCDYCDRCPIHGLKKRPYYDDYPRPSFKDTRDKHKIVLMGIPEQTEQNDLQNFCRKYNLEPVYVRVTQKRDNGILEFANSFDKEEALAKLDGQELLGKIVSTRIYRVNSEDRVKRRREGDFRQREEEKRDDKSPRYVSESPRYVNAKEEKKEEEKEHGNNNDVYAGLNESEGN